LVVSIDIPSVATGGTYTHVPIFTVEGRFSSPLSVSGTLSLQAFGRFSRSDGAVLIVCPGVSTVGTVQWSAIRQ
jgi:hypothetical protein